MTNEIPPHRRWQIPDGVDDPGWNLEQSYASLPDSFYTKVLPESVVRPQLVQFNDVLAELLGLDFQTFSAVQLAQLFSGNQILDDSEPLAQAYAGHQYGGFTMLGDGRAVLLAEHRDPQGLLWDLQLKGSGRTRYSRQGDGRAALGPMLREFLISEAMAAIGIPTTRSLAVVATGEEVVRERRLPGAVLTRVASSHLRVGTFEYANSRNHPEELVTLADYAIARHYPELSGSPDRYRRFLGAVIQRQLKLVSHWLSIGFIHGVMNTDNVSIAGETIDYGPCAYMNTFDPATVFSSIDRYGRYAYANQSRIAAWNMARFAESLLPILSAERDEAIEIATAEVDKMPGWLAEEWLGVMRRKLALRADAKSSLVQQDRALIDELFDWMKQERADFTNTFRILAGDHDPGECGYWENVGFSEWAAKWEARILIQGETVPQAQARMRDVNPVVIPRNHRVEEVLAAANRGELEPFRRLLKLLQSPFERKGTEPADLLPPSPEADACYQTFCGT